MRTADTTFLDGTGQPLALTATNYQGLMGRIDPVRSSVSLRNPHGGYEPNHDGAERTFDTLEFAAVDA